MWERFDNQLIANVCYSSGIWMYLKILRRTRCNAAAGGGGGRACRKITFYRSKKCRGQCEVCCRVDCFVPSPLHRDTGSHLTAQIYESIQPPQIDHRLQTWSTMSKVISTGLLTLLQIFVLALSLAIALLLKCKPFPTNFPTKQGYRDLTKTINYWTSAKQRTHVPMWGFIDP